ncbi:MAG: diguanylate cyclase (GGDEF)-like protein [Candidatus Azotimanducaceae bacterium]|jgi:diguanylate cyclase (GGDEF)-like protein
MLFIVLFTANFILTVLNSRLYLENQLQSHADDTASSLGLSMTTALQEKDIAHLDVLANAIFDRGYYQSITLKGLRGETILEKRNLIAIDDVPAWFLSLVALPSPVGQSEIMSGWSQLGVLSVISHPGHAYRDLWRISTDFFYMFIAILLLSYILLGLCLKLILRPLKEVEKQANAICEKKFTTLESIPRTRELKLVVEAMNRMSHKLRDLFAKQVELTENLRQEARTDPVTGLINRREFNAVLASKLNDESGAGSGALALIQIQNLVELNHNKGRNEGDAILKQIGQRLKTDFGQGGNLVKNSAIEPLIARYSGAGFIAYFQNIGLEHARVKLLQLQTALDTIQLVDDASVDYSVDIGMTFQANPKTLSSLLTQADAALSTAQTQAGNGAHFVTFMDGEPLSKLIKQANEWKKTLELVMTNEDVLLHYQPIYQYTTNNELKTNYKLTKLEVFMRIQVAGEIIHAGVFLPMVERFDWLPKFDKIVVLQVFSQLADSKYELVVNLSTRSILDEDFTLWLGGFLKAQQKRSKRVIFEIQEHAIQLSFSKVKALVELGTSLGFRFSVDQFGISQSTFAYLHSLDITFLKIDRSIVDGISDSPDNQFFVQSVLQIAESRDITIIAEGVEQLRDLETLHSLGVDMAMGYLLGRPAAEVGNFPQDL